MELLGIDCACGSTSGGASSVSLCMCRAKHPGNSWCRAAAPLCRLPAVPPYRPCPNRILGMTFWPAGAPAATWTA